MCGEVRALPGAAGLAASLLFKLGEWRPHSRGMTATRCAQSGNWHVSADYTLLTLVITAVSFRSGRSADGLVMRTAGTVVVR